MDRCGNCGHFAYVHEGPRDAVKACLVCSCREFCSEQGPSWVTKDSSERVEFCSEQWPLWETKDSGKRVEFDSGMVRDAVEGKARFELLLPLGVPYSSQFLVRVAQLMERGAAKYQDRNWEKARGAEEMERFKSSAIRHLMQWASGEVDEDHAAAVVFNLLGYETTKWRRDNGGE